MTTLTMTDAAGEVTSILELPAHATDTMLERVVSAAAILCDARGWTLRYSTVLSRLPSTLRGLRLAGVTVEA